MQPRDVALADGTRVHLRDIRPDDADELRRAFEQLSPASRHSRFLGGIASLTDQALRYLTNVDGKNHVAVVATLPEAADRGVAVARFVRAPDAPWVADVAITVVDEMQGRGLGRLLAGLLSELARALAVESFRGEVLVDNTACRRLLREVGARTAPNEDGTLSFDVPLAGADDDAFRRMLRASAAGLIGVSGR